MIHKYYRILPLIMLLFKRLKQTYIGTPPVTIAALQITPHVV